MLPQGMFSVAVATVLFPALSRLASRRDFAGLQQLIGSGMRQIAMLLIPSAAAFVALATPIVRLVYERGDFDAESTSQVSEALFWFSFSLPVSGFTLLLTRSFFSLQRPWLPTRLALYSIVVNVVVSLRAARADGDRRRGARHDDLERRAHACSRRAGCGRRSAGSSWPGRSARAW